MPVAVQRCDRFVARTMNWLYDHLLCLRSHEPLILCDKLENRTEFPDLTAWEYPRYGWSRWIGRRVGLQPRSLVRARRCAPRVLHSHFAYVALHDFELWNYLGVPWVVAFYGADAYQATEEEVPGERYRRLFEACARVLALGPAMSRRLQELGCPREKIAVHPLGVSVEQIRSQPRTWDRSGPLEVLFAGTIREKKGVQFALRGVAAARDAGVPVRLTLVGEPMAKQGDRETETEVCELITELSLGDIVQRSPMLEYHKLLELAWRSHVFLAPSVVAANGDSEGTPFVLQQMMASGMPVIATRHSDIPFIFGDLEHLLVAERDADAIAARLTEYAENPAFIAEHGRAMRARIESRFDVRACASRLSEIYAAL